MSGFIKKFKKLGGAKLLKQYIKTGVFFTALSCLIRLGTSQKALEILRLETQYKLHKKLSKKFRYVLEDYKEDPNLERKQSNKVWVCWLQGIENAPLLMQRCFHSLKKHLTDREIIVITEKNMLDYVEIPQYILEKLNKGQITKTFFSDILRLALLIKYGGTWIDATVLCTGDNYPSYLFDSDLFMYQILKPGRDGHCITVSSWFLSSCSNNKVLITTLKMIYEYWKKYDYLVEYNLIHHFLDMSLDFFKDEYDKMPKFSNEVPHILILEAFNEFDSRNYENIKELTCFHKLTNKRDPELLQREGTYYDMIVNKGIEE